jgi:hypothetical protein
VGISFCRPCSTSEKIQTMDNYAATPLRIKPVPPSSPLKHGLWYNMRGRCCNPHDSWAMTHVHKACTPALHMPRPQPGHETPHPWKQSSTDSACNDPWQVKTQKHVDAVGACTAHCRCARCTDVLIYTLRNSDIVLCYYAQGSTSENL